MRFRTTILLFSLLPLCGWLWFAAPAAACGCGAYIPREGDAHVQQERALVRWDGTTEDIVMALSVAGRSSDAAWILPVPGAADVELADARLFDALQELTKPEERVERRRARDRAIGDAAPGAPPVTLLERKELGPFDISTLAATDASALGDWLASNGYQFPDALAAALQPYIDQQWLYVAVRLTPAAASEDLTGDLDPLRVTFTSNRIVYPMRLSALAQQPLPVYLYVLAPHRVAPSNVERFGASPDVQYANWIEASALPADSPITPFVPERMFLTKFYAQVFNPASIQDDWTFEFAAADETYRDVVVRYEYVDSPLDGALPLLIVLVALLGAGTVFGALYLARRGRQRAASRPS